MVPMVGLLKAASALNQSLALSADFQCEMEHFWCTWLGNMLVIPLRRKKWYVCMYALKYVYLKRTINVSVLITLSEEGCCS